jgi:hypothetical protein
VLNGWTAFDLYSIIAVCVAALCQYLVKRQGADQDNHNPDLRTLLAFPPFAQTFAYLIVGALWPAVIIQILSALRISISINQDDDD